MTFSKEVLDKPLPASNHDQALTLDRTLNNYVSKLQQEDIIAQTKSVICEMLPSGDIKGRQWLIHCT